MFPTLDYAEVGFVCGLEVHQQLLTPTKLFCRCPAGLYTETHDGTVLRHMRPTLSELGEYDGTALMEFKTKKNIVYLLNVKNVCTYEMDDTPPFLVNQQAIDVAIEQCLMLGCDIVDEVHIARKQYLDGSIPTGFQRTAVVGVNGKIPFRGRTLSVTQVTVEEDSCREVRDRGHCIVWRADRLGMPLIETVTGPDLRTPDEVEEAILLVGRVCRSTGHVRTGLGASRQDVNVSVRGGRRVEIKGVPKAGWAPRLVHGEAWRQVNLLKLRDELHRRGFTDAGSLRVESQDVTQLFAGTEIPYLRPEAWDRWVEEEKMRPGFELGRDPTGSERRGFRASPGRSPGRRSPSTSSRTSSRAGSASLPASTRFRTSSTPRRGPTHAGPAPSSNASAAASAAARTTRSSWSGAPRRTPSPPARRSASGTSTPRRESLTRRGSLSSTGRPTSSGSSPAPTGCTPTPTARRRASRASGSRS